MESPVEACSPFSMFATYYDQFMLKYVNYREWVDYVVRIFEHFKVVPEVVLDVACGTGIPTVLLARRGYRMIGVDRSGEMLAVLETRKNGLPITTLRSDIRDFHLTEPVDAAISLYDSLNYLLFEEDLVRCFRCVRRTLKPSGLLVFDMNTLHGLSEHWGTRTITRETGGVVSVWQNEYNPETRVSTLRLLFWKREPGPSRKYQEIHEERAYTVEEVGRSLRSAGFEEMHFFEHPTFLPLRPSTPRMMVVAR